jgi:hypothetical protein
LDGSSPISYRDWRIALLFWHKRRDVVMRAHIFERAAILEHRAAFIEFMTRVEQLEVDAGTGLLDFTGKFGVPSRAAPDRVDRHALRHDSVPLVALMSPAVGDIAFSLPQQNGRKPLWVRQA